MAYWKYHPIITLLYWWHTSNRQGLQTNDTPIWIVTSVWTHRSLRLWLQQPLSLSNLLITPFYLPHGSRIILFMLNLTTWYSVSVYTQVFYFPSPLCIHKILLQQPPISFWKHLEQTQLRSEHWIYLLWSHLMSQFWIEMNPS